MTFVEKDGLEGWSREEDLCSFFFKELQSSNQNQPVFVPVTLEETPNGGGATTTEQLGDLFVPKEDVVPQYEKGNLVNDGRWIYSWDVNNRLQTMTPTPEATAAHSAAGHTTVLPILDFLYDWRGRRMSKKVTYGTASNSPFTVTSFVYDGWNIVATIDRTYNEADFQVVRPVWGLDLSGSFQGAGGVGGLLCTRTREDVYTAATYSYTANETERHLPSYDGNGNIIAWTTDTGTTTATRDFDAFGNIVTNQGTRWSASAAFGFSTKYEDVETGLLYYGYRHYDPVTGRWPSRDPIGGRGGLNLYGMVGNDAVGAWDYLGRDLQTTRQTPINVTIYPKPGPNDNGFEKEVGEALSALEVVSSGEYFLDVSSVKDANEKMKKVMEKKSDDCCIKKLEIEGHGAPGYQHVGPVNDKDGKPILFGVGGIGVGPLDEKGRRRTGGLNGAKGSNLFDDITFCKKCTIILRGCNQGGYKRGRYTDAAYSKGLTSAQAFTQFLANITQCDIRGFQGECHPAPPPGSGRSSPERQNIYPPLLASPELQKK